MEIFYNTKKIAGLCNDNKKSLKKFGEKATKGLLQRLTQLKAVSRLGDFKFDKPHPLKGNRLRQFAITVYGGLRIILEASEPSPMMEDGSIDWNNVEKIKIITVEDYH